MIAQIGLSILLGGIMIYALTQYARAPAIGFAALLVAAAGLYFVWLPAHATWLAAQVGIGRGVDLILYVWVVISLLVLLKSSFETASADGIDNGLGARSGHRQRPLSSHDEMSAAAPIAYGPMRMRL